MSTVRTDLENAAVVRPGDKLVVGIAERITRDEAMRAKRMISEWLPGVDVVVLGSIGAMAVIRDEDQADITALTEAPFVATVHVDEIRIS